ncbi:MAG: hypothetical protein K8L99_20740 [Anaerolineae bacterium]|nr:hypothetical protein [Anaerolineae bacterium]
MNQTEQERLQEGWEKIKAVLDEHHLDFHVKQDTTPMELSDGSISTQRWVVGLRTLPIPEENVEEDSDADLG